MTRELKALRSKDALFSNAGGKFDFLEAAPACRRDMSDADLEAFDSLVEGMQRLKDDPLTVRFAEDQAFGPADDPLLDDSNEALSDQDLGLLLLANVQHDRDKQKRLDMQKRLEDMVSDDDSDSEPMEPAAGDIMEAPPANSAAADVEAHVAPTPNPVDVWKAAARDLMEAPGWHPPLARRVDVGFDFFGHNSLDLSDADFQRVADEHEDVLLRIADEHGHCVGNEQKELPRSQPAESPANGMEDPDTVSRVRAWSDRFRDETDALMRGDFVSAADGIDAHQVDDYVDGGEVLDWDSYGLQGDW
jgi:hypothetical protein